MTQKTVWVLQHTPPETLGTIADALDARGVRHRYLRPFLGERVPVDTDGTDGLVIMGGPMGVHDVEQNPFLRDEMRLIENALKQGKPVLGVCLGSQMLASVLGAHVTRGKKREIGWYRVRIEDGAGDDPLWKGVSPAFTAYHWHGDVFELPKGAVRLASSEATEHQAFRWGSNAYGFLFHLEVTENMIREMIRCFSDELARENLDGGWIMQKWDEHAAHLEKISHAVFGRWAALV
ncbi:MAG: gamma-glutamyl-gamma-aminobutyrate hydrolase family protein [Candidatus Omnitrophica bacterium]|nr:gamma-glutamyl-gamma-aminobutyrate hydrolase family protein [Candidatus Omnitrophota bacterium]